MFKHQREFTQPAIDYRAIYGVPADHHEVEPLIVQTPPPRSQTAPPAVGDTFEKKYRSTVALAGHEDQLGHSAPRPSLWTKAKSMLGGKPTDAHPLICDKK